MALRYAVWGSPWICTVAVSASLAQAMNVAVGRGSSALQREGGVSLRVAFDDTSAKAILFSSHIMAIDAVSGAVRCRPARGI